MRLTIFLLFMSSLSFSQAAFLKEGESGATVGLALVTGADQTDLLLGAGYSPNGLFNISGFVQRGTLNNDFGLNNAQVLGLYSALSYFVIKQDDLPIDLSVSLIGAVGRVNSDELNILNWDVTTRQVGLGTTIYGKLETSSNIQIQPFGAINYNIVGLKVDTNGFGSQDDSDTNINFSLGANVILDLDYNRFAISPSIVFQEGATRFGVSLDYLFD